MGINVFQVGVFNDEMFSSGSVYSGSYASEYPLAFDNINASGSRLVKIMGVWANVDNQDIFANQNADSWGQPTGLNNNNNSAAPCRPNGGYFTRGLWFSNTAFAPSANRNGYIGSFVSGVNYNNSLDWAHDINGNQVDYEPLYSHGQAVWPMGASIPQQWRDPSNPPADGAVLVQNAGSAYTRTPYMPPSTFLFHIDSAGPNNIGSGNLKFHFENRPSLRAVGFNDGNSPLGSGSTFPGCTTIVGTPGPYGSDPQGNGGNTPTNNPYEYYQATGTRPLNSRGLSLHLAKVMDNGWNAVGYVYEEDGQTLAPNAYGAPPRDLSVNCQTEYRWQRDNAGAVTATAADGTHVTITVNNTFQVGQTVLIQGLTNETWLNGQLLTVTSLIGAGPTYTGFQALSAHGAYGTTGESYGYAVHNPDFRVRQAATFNINEEYYGFVMDTKCTIWSNKASMIPLLFFDLKNIWTGSSAPRIAGVAVVPTYINATGQLMYQVFFLSEDGYFARYDFTQTNGILELAGTGSFAFASAPPSPVRSGEAYGAMQARGVSAAITATQVSGNTTLTVTCNNTFQVGDSVNITGTAEGFLNNTTVTVASLVGAGPVYTGFTATIPTQSNYTNASDTGTAVGYSIWALYGTMTPDPRQTQTNAFTANINLFRYAVGAGTWGSVINSGLTGRHNGRSLSEFVVARDGNIYILCEDVTVTGAYVISNASGVTTNINWQVMVYSPTAAAWNTSKINGTPIQYGTNMGPNGTTPNQTNDYWFYNINAFLHDVAPNYILIQGNWTAGSLWTLNTASAPSLSNANLASVAASTLFPNGTYSGYNIPGLTNPATDPVSIKHNHDFATTGSDRTIFLLNTFVYNQNGANNNPGIPLFYAQPSFNWASPTAAYLMPANYESNGSYGSIEWFQQDYWSYQFIGSQEGAAFDHVTWVFPTLVQDNYIHFVRGGVGGQDGLPDGSSVATTYGRAFGQSLGYLPTYWKWNGTTWALADNWADAVANPYTIGAYAGGFSSTIPAPYGLAVQFGPTSSDSFTGGEFATFNLCWGNTKYTRKGRFSWAMFAGQTFINSETRTIATQKAMTMNFIDTDIFSISLTAPTSQTPNTAPLTNPANNQSSGSMGWTTQVSWPKTDASHSPYDATPLVETLTCVGFNPNTWINPPAINPTGSEPGTWSWTVGGNTYVSSESSNSPYSFAPSVYAFSGRPGAFNGDFWQSGGSSPSWLQIDLGLGNAQPCRSYSYRNVYDTNDNLGPNAPTNFQLLASNDGTFTDNGGGPYIIDDHTGLYAAVLTSGQIRKGMGFNCNGPAAGTPFRYYRYQIYGTVNNPSNGGLAFLQMLRLNSAVMTSSVNFTDLAFFAYGTQEVTSYNYPYLRNWQFARGLKIEVSTNGGTSYTTIMAPGGPYPLWRAHNGFVFSFNRQVGVTNIRVTVQHGYNLNLVTGNQPATTAFGPFYLFDYDPQDVSGQAALNAARLGLNTAPQGTPAAASWDLNSLGVATDVASLSIDSTSPNLITPYSTLQDGAVLGFYDFLTVPAGQYKMHPFFGFVLFSGAGSDAGVSTQTGTNLAIQYQWGRRV